MAGYKRSVTRALIPPFDDLDVNSVTETSGTYDDATMMTMAKSVLYFAANERARLKIPHKIVSPLMEFNNMQICETQCESVSDVIGSLGCSHVANNYTYRLRC